MSEWIHQRGICLLYYLDDKLVVAEPVPLLLQHQEQLLQLCRTWGLLSGEVKPQAVQHDSVSWNADRHHLREVLSGELGGCQVPRSWGQVPSLPVSCEDVAIALGPHGVSGELHSPGLCSDVPSSVTAEGLQVSCCGQSHSAGASDSGIRGFPSLVAGRREVVGRGSSIRASSIFSAHWSFSSQLRLSSPRLDGCGGLISGGEGASHKYFGNKGCSFSLQCLPGHGGRGIGHSHEQQCCHRCLPEETKGHSVKGIVWSGTGDCPLDRSSLCYSVCEIHSWKGECFNGPAQSPRPVSSTEWSLLPRVFDSMCEVFDCPLMDFFTTWANAKLPLYVSPVPDLMFWKQDTFQHPLDDLHTYNSPPFTLLCQVLSHIRLMRRLSLLLIVLLWPQKA